MEELKEMCRVCMAEAEDLIDMYDKKKTHVDDRLSAELKKREEPEPFLPDLFKECSPICVESGDLFPKKVCDPCLRKMRDAVYFHRRYAKSMDYIARVKMEKRDLAIISDLEQEEWDLHKENEEEDEDQENKDEDKENMDEDEEEEHDEHEDSDEEDEDEVVYDDEEDSEDFEDFEDDEEEYIPMGTKSRSKPGSFQCPDCPETFTRQAQLTEHSANHSKDSTKQNGLNTRPKRRSAKY